MEWPSPARNVRAMTLRVLTWNLWWRFGPWEQRQPAIARVLVDEAPDVVCLQEVWADGTAHQAELLAAPLGFHVARTEGQPTDGPTLGNAVLSRWPVIEQREIALPRADGTPGHRRALVAWLDTPWGAWPVVSTHLEYRFDESDVRERQARSILELVAEVRGNPERDLPVIVAGDFNAVPDSDEIRLLTGRRAAPVRNLVLSDCWEHVGEGAGLTWRSDNPYQEASAWPDRRLDYVFVSWPRPKPVGNPVRTWLAGVHAVDGVVPSDHAAVVVELAVPSAASSA